MVANLITTIRRYYFEYTLSLSKPLHLYINQA